MNDSMDYIELHESGTKLINTVKESFNNDEKEIPLLKKDLYNHKRIKSKNLRKMQKKSKRINRKK